MLSVALEASAYAPPESSAPGDAGDIAPWQQRALTDRQVYRALAAELAAPEIRMSLATTLDGRRPHALDAGVFVAFAQDVAAYLEAVAQGATASVPGSAIEIPVAAANPEDLFALVVELRIAGGGGADVRAAEEQVVTPIAPLRSRVGREPPTLGRFAADLEAAYATPTVHLKVAVGPSPDGGGGGAAWILRLRSAAGAPGEPEGVGFAVEGPGRYYAPRPLAGVVIARPAVPVVDFDRDQGLDWAHPTLAALTGALDLWGRHALAAVDRFLEADLAGAAFRIDEVDPDGSGHLGGILALKEALAEAIAATVVPVLVEPGLDPADGAAGEDAREVMRELILARAENAYAVSAVCQFAATVSARFAGDPAGSPRFRGPVSAHGPASAAAGYRAQPGVWAFTPARPRLVPERSFVTSAITIVDPPAQSHLPLELDFTVSTIEPGVERTAGGESIAAPWLSLVIPFSVAIGAVDIPVVVREIPAPAVPVAQVAQPGEDSGVDPAAALERAMSWRYAVTYVAEAFAQDEVEVVVEFNRGGAEPEPSPAAAVAVAPSELDLFDHLARFVRAWPALEEALVETLVAGALDLDPSSPGYRRARRLVGDFHDLLAPLPQAWRAWRPPASEAAEGPVRSAAASPGRSEFRYAVGERADRRGVLVATRRLGASTAGVWDRATGTRTALAPPDLEIDDGDTVWAAEPVSPGAGAFHFADRLGNLLTRARGSSLPRTSTFAGRPGEGLDVAAYQNASAAFRVFRNRDVLPGVATAADFVFVSPGRGFAAPVAPELRSDRVFDRGRLPGTWPSPLIAHVQGILDLLFAGTEPGTELVLGLDAEFHESLGPDRPGAVLPILRRPGESLSRVGCGPLAAAISGQILDWWAAVRPGPGALGFRLRLLSSANPRGPALVEVSRLMLEPGDVTELA